MQNRGLQYWWLFYHSTTSSQSFKTCKLQSSCYSQSPNGLRSLCSSRMIFTPLSEFSWFVHLFSSDAFLISLIPIIVYEYSIKASYNLESWSKLSGFYVVRFLFHSNLFSFFYIIKAFDFIWSCDVQKFCCFGTQIFCTEICFCGINLSRMEKSV